MLDPIEVKRLINLVDCFALEMKAKLLSNSANWDKYENIHNIHSRLKDSVNRNDFQAIDIANLAMMLWHHTKEDLNA